MEPLLRHRQDACVCLDGNHDGVLLLATRGARRIKTHPDTQLETQSRTRPTTRLTNSISFNLLAFFFFVFQQHTHLEHRCISAKTSLCSSLRQSSLVPSPFRFHRMPIMPCPPGTSWSARSLSKLWKSAGMGTLESAAVIAVVTVVVTSSLASTATRTRGLLSFRAVTVTLMSGLRLLHADTVTPMSAAMTVVVTVAATLSPASMATRRRGLLSFRSVTETRMKGLLSLHADTVTLMSAAMTVVVTVAETLSPAGMATRMRGLLSFHADMMTLMSAAMTAVVVIVDATSSLASTATRMSDLLSFHAATVILTSAAGIATVIVAVDVAVTSRLASMETLVSGMVSTTKGREDELAALNTLCDEQYVTLALNVVYRSDSMDFTDKTPKKVVVSCIGITVTVVVCR